MADTTTPILGLIKPEVGASTDTWGPKYHAAMDKIDSLFTDPAKEMLKLANGGTGADTAAGARTNLGLGTIALLNSINTNSIDDSAVTTPKVADGAVTFAKLASGVGIPAGTKMLFQQTAAPTGWTKDVVHNDKALRIVSGTAGSGGSGAFSSIFASRGIAGSSNSVAAGGTVASHTLDISQIPSHTHTFTINQKEYDGQGSSNANYGAAQSGGAIPVVTQASGGSGGHSHGFTGAAHSHTISATLDMAVAYVDLIIATKN